MDHIPEIQIRLATIEDATFIALLGRVTFTEAFGHLFRDHGDLQEYYNKTFSVQKIRKSLQKEQNVYWLALADGLPVGYAKLKLQSATPFLDRERVCQLQKIYVLKDFLSLKIGLALQTRLLDKAKSASYDHIWLSVYKENERAVRFYLKNGFKEIGEHKFSIGREHFDFMSMAKKL
ncbi:MAG: GNAT family N-acetyltransferase [Flavobacteriaceae bacterium]